MASLFYFEEWRLKHKLFFLLSITILFSPAGFQLANPFNNPNTQFTDFPKPLQEAYAETVVGTVTRDSTWSSEILAANATHITKKSIFGLTEFITDSNGKFVNTIVTEDANYVYVDARTPVKISKSSCNLLELDKDRIANEPSTRKTTSYTISTSDNAVAWQDQVVSSCSILYLTNSTGTFVTADHGKGKLVITYVWYAD